MATPIGYLQLPLKGNAPVGKKVSSKDWSIQSKIWHSAFTYSLKCP